jgi:alkanesulfonate monooxygenase SsuD/methylene tetrahydromethanopterin reductase-like flavin-dependent oxidoreductase (luciferase family)
VLIATQAAMFDHLAEGRFIFGISPGALPTDSEAIGTLELDKNALFAEAIDVILAIWERDPPYDIDFPNNRFKVSTAKTMMKHLGVGFMGKPYQQPRPEICGTVVAPFSPGVVLMGKRDFHPLSANFLLSQHLKSHWTNYSKGKAEVGQTASTEDWRVARTVFVADDDKVAERYGRSDPNSPYGFYYGQMRGKLARGKRLYVFKSHKEQPDEEVTHDFVMDRLVLHGSVNKVVDQILALREEIGEFGELVYGGMDWVDPALAKRSARRRGDAARQCGDRQEVRGGVGWVDPRESVGGGNPSPDTRRTMVGFAALNPSYDFFSTSRVGVSGVSPPRRRAKVSVPLSAQVPSTARRANTSHAASQSPSE